MLNSCFVHKPNPPRKLPSALKVTVAPSGKNFESRAFAALFNNAKCLGIKELYQCKAARMDGYLVTVNDETILLEMKESIHWGAMQSAGFQFLAGRSLLGLKANRAIIVFETLSNDWQKIKPAGAWGQLALHASEVNSHIEIGGLQVLANGSVCSTTMQCSPSGSATLLPSIS